MDKLVLHNFLDDHEPYLQEALALYPTNYDEYNNPFEKKYTLHKLAIEPYGLLDQVFYQLRNATWWVSRLLDVPIEYCDVRHYGGVFLTTYLKPHVDAGKHPQNYQTKIATAILYLTQAQLIFWKGEPAWFNNPTINQLDEVLNLAPNDLVLFTNHDTAYHEVPEVYTNSPRVCITVSYIAPPDFKDPRFMNQRTRAYFARHMNHKDSPELAELRNKRSDEQHYSEVYRTNDSSTN